jgi:hypothetical protein
LSGGAVGADVAVKVRGLADQEGQAGHPGSVDGRLLHHSGNLINILFTNKHYYQNSFFILMNLFFSLEVNNISYKMTDLILVIEFSL